MFSTVTLASGALVGMLSEPMGGHPAPFFKGMVALLAFCRGGPSQRSLLFSQDDRLLRMAYPGGSCAAKERSESIWVVVTPKVTQLSHLNIFVPVVILFDVGYLFVQSSFSPAISGIEMDPCHNQARFFKCTHCDSTVQSFFAVSTPKKSWWSWELCVGGP